MIKRNYKYIFIVLLLIALLILPFVATNTYLLMLFNQTLINIIVVLGLNFITGLTGQMNLGTAGIFAMGAYTTALLSTRFNLSPWITLLASALVGALIGILLGWPSLRIKGIYLALTTIGFAEIVRLFLNNLTNLTGGTNGVFNIPSFKFFNIDLNNEKSFYYFVFIFAVLMTIIAVSIVHSKWGRAFKAIRDNDQAVESCGISISEIKIKAFIACAIYASTAGALYAHLMGYINPADFTFDLSVKYLMMLMLGGIGSIPGNILGAMVVTLLPEFLRFMQDYYWLIFSSILLVIVIFLPHGIVSLFSGFGKSKTKKITNVRGKQ